MTKDNIIGRYPEKENLAKALVSQEPEFIAVYGRRRIGKTFLVREFFSEKICFEIVGIHNATLKDQLNNFAGALQRGMRIPVPTHVPDSWFEAFSQLEQFLDSIENQKQQGKKKVVFIDELPWINTPRSKFLSALEHFWNSFGSRKSYLILIVCGSAASWMLQKIVNAKGGLHNRLTRQIRLLPFNLLETEQFLKSRGVILTRFQIISLYMVTGGVPFYLMQAEKGLSSAQIIDKICFIKDGILRHEFEKLYASLFIQSDQHVKILNTLRTNKSGMNRNMLLTRAGILSGGTFSLMLNDLEESGFITSFVPLGKKSNDAIYRITDEFTLFYFDWIKPLGKTDPGSGYWLSRQNDPRRRVWTGYAWEAVCMKHIRQIKNSLGIAMVDTFIGPWTYSPPQNAGVPGTQIDMLIDRRDAAINICEMKFSESDFVIDADYAKVLRNKVEIFRNITKTKKNVFVTLITTFGLSENVHSGEIVSSVLSMDNLF